MNEYMQSNLEWWNEAAQIHVRGDAYELAAFKAGKSKLKPLELTEVGDVAGKSLLHLQCHFGLDTLSWARLGATVTGVDFSDQAIQLAKAISRDVGIGANFICSNIYDLRSNFPPAAQFDIVFTSYGAIGWLPDLQAWGQLIADYLKPGGFFYIAEGHPFMWTIDEKGPELKVGYPYFSSEPIKDESQGTYAEKEAEMEHHTTYGWNHSFSEIFSSLLAAGLRIDFLHEHPFCAWDPFPEMEEDENKFWRFKDPQKRKLLPLMFSLKATKPI